MKTQLFIKTAIVTALVISASANFPNNINDDEDELLAGTAGGATDITRWYVSEPYINLWLYSQPLTYQNSFGQSVGFGLSYKQRNSRSNANSFGVGANWECSWLSYVEYATNGSSVTVGATWLALGGRRDYIADGVTKEFKSYTTMTVLRDGGNNVIGFQINKSSGARDLYTYLLNLGASQNYAYLAQQVDSIGRTNTLQYDTISSIVRLRRMIDADNRTNSITYDGTYTKQISLVTDHYGRTAGIKYNGSGLIQCITNTTSVMCDNFAYDSQGFVNKYITDYGTNTFVATTNSYGGFSLGGTNKINRSITVTEPNLGKEIFLYRDQSTKLKTGSGTDLIPPSYPSGEVPVTSPLANTFDNAYMDARNTFHWGKREYEHLSSTFLNTGNFDDLTLADYKIGQLKHWMRKSNDVATVTGVLSLNRNGSPDGSIDGQKVWLDYSGKNGSQKWCQGTNVGPSFNALLLADGTTRFSYNEQNQWGLPLKLVSTYTSGTNVAQRTMTNLYASNGIDLIEAHGFNAELLSSNRFNTAHQILTNYNAVNDVTIYTYDSAGRLTSTKSAAGLTITNLYYSTGNHIGWLNRTLAIEISQTNGFGYQNGVVATQTNALGLVSTLSVDVLGRATNIVTPSLTNYFTFNRLDNQTTGDAVTNTTQYCYNEMGRLCQITNANTNVTSFAYCGCGALAAITNAVQKTTVFNYDYNGNRTSVSLPDTNTVFSWKYDLLGQMTNAIDALNNSVTNYYSNQGLLATATNASGSIGSYKYDVYDRATNIVDPNGLELNITYDALGRVLTKSYPDGGVEKFQYTALGVVAHTNQLGKVTRYGYDNAGRMTSITNANLEVTRYVYDLNGNVTQLIDGNGHTNKFIYDQYGRLTNQTDALNNIVLTNSFDGTGNLAIKWMPETGQIKYSYDPNGNLLKIDYPNDPDVTFGYDELDEITTIIDSLGTTHFSYTPNGEIASEDGPWDMDTVSYTYANGIRESMRLTQPNASAWLMTYHFDSASRLTNIESSAGAFAYQYQAINPNDPQGRLLKTLTYPNGAYVTNSYNNMGQLLGTILKNSSHTTLNSHSYTYNTAAQQTRHTRIGGDFVDYTYDDIGQLRSAWAKEAGGTQRSNETLGYTYDSGANLLYRTNNALLEAFSVDTANQLQSIQGSGTLTVSGNTTAQASSVTVNGNASSLYGDKTFSKSGFTIPAGLTTFTAIAQESFGRKDTNTVATTFGKVPFAWNLNGDLVNDGDKYYVYDDENRMIYVEYPSTWAQVFQYDALSRRRVRQDWVFRNGNWIKESETRYIYDGLMVIQERNQDNLPSCTYTRGLDVSGSLDEASGVGGLLARTDVSHANEHKTAYYHHDSNGNVSIITDRGGNIAAKYDYDPFGRVLFKSGRLCKINRMMFAGKEIDERSNLIHYGYRYFHSDIQRWTTKDPVGFGGGSVNLLAFTSNDAVNRFDPSGLFSMTQAFGFLDDTEFGGFSTTGVLERPEINYDWASTTSADGLSQDWTCHIKVTGEYKFQTISLISKPGLHKNVVVGTKAQKNYVLMPELLITPKGMIDLRNHEDKHFQVEKSYYDFVFGQLETGMKNLGKITFKGKSDGECTFRANRALAILYILALERMSSATPALIEGHRKIDYGHVAMFRIVNSKSYNFIGSTYMDPNTFDNPIKVTFGPPTLNILLHPGEKMPIFP
jgi:RHS repeat-associated protein